MNDAYKRLKRRLKWLNIRAYTWDDIPAILKRERIKLKFYPMAEKLGGYYHNIRVNKYRKRYICINSKLTPFEQLFVILHELVHHFLHLTKKKEEIFNHHLDKLNTSKEEC